MYMDYSELNFESCVYSDDLISQLVTLNNVSKHKIDIPEIKKAIYYARLYHGDQKRDSGEAYYSHPLAVARMLSKYSFKTDLIITAILHDTIEDTELTFEMIEKIFTTTVANNVQALTRIVAGKKISVEESLYKMCNAGDEGVLIVKLCDRLHNIETIKAKSEAKIHRTIQEVLKIFVALSFRIQNSSLEKELYELCMTSFSKQPTYSHLFSLAPQSKLSRAQTIRLLEPL